MANLDMENHITKFVEQSGATRRLIMGLRQETFFTEDQLEKFVESVVAECIDCLEHQSTHWLNDSQCLKLHFGLIKLKDSK